MLLYGEVTVSFVGDLILGATINALIAGIDVFIMYRLMKEEWVHQFHNSSFSPYTQDVFV